MIALPAIVATLTLVGGPDVPDAIIAAVAMHETGSVWRGHLASGTPQWLGPDMSAWQISRALLHDLHADPWQAGHDPVYAESIVRRWLAHLYAITRNWRSALGAYHSGLRHDHSAAARRYAQDCLNLAQIYVP